MQQIEQRSKIIGNYIQKELLGEGSQGSVYRMVNMMNNQEYAAKVFDKNKTNLKTLKMELEILLKCMKFNNENIVKFFELIQTKENYILILEKCDGDLRQILVREEELTEDEALNYLKQIVNGIQLLHSIKISHRDLKPRNILIKGDQIKGYTIKIADLGLGCIQDKSGLIHCSQAFGTHGYIAPEVLWNLDHNPKVADMYSLGIIFRQLLRKSHPLDGIANDLARQMTEPEPEKRLKWTTLTQFLENKIPIQKERMMNISTFYLVEREEKVNFFLELYENMFRLTHGNLVNPFSPAYMILKLVYIESRQREIESNDTLNEQQLQCLKELRMRIEYIKAEYDILYEQNGRIKFDGLYQVIMKEELQNQYVATKNFHKNLKFILKVYFQQLNHIQRGTNSPLLILKVKCQTLIAINYGLSKLQDLIYGELKHNNQNDYLTDMVNMAQNKEINLEEIDRNLD